jgi:membrane protein
MIKEKLKSIWEFTKDVFNKFIDDKCPKLGAALSFYTIFSLAPIIVISISVAGLIFGREAARGEIIVQIQDLVGYEGAKVIQTALKNAQYSSQGVIAITVSFVALVIGSTIVFVELQDSLNIIWKVKPKPGNSIIKGLLKDRVQSFAMVIATGFLLLVSLVISAVISGLNNYISSGFFNIPNSILDFSDIVISLFITFLLFMMIFRFLPDVHIGWRHVWVGALVTSVFFVLGKYLISLYLGTSTLGSTYGAAGSLVIFLLWVYYSAQILFLGAEFTQVYAYKYGEGIKPASKFMKYTEEAILSEGTGDKKTSR